MPELSQLWVCTRPSECQLAMSLLCPQQRTHSLRWPLLRIYWWLSLMPCMNMCMYSISYIFHAFVHKKPSKLPACLSIVEWEDMQGLGIIFSRIICLENGLCTFFLSSTLLIRECPWREEMWWSFDQSRSDCTKTGRWIFLQVASYTVTIISIRCAIMRFLAFMILIAEISTRIYHRHFPSVFEI